MRTAVRSGTSSRTRLVLLLGLSSLALGFGCGGDDDDESPAERIAAACSDTCRDIADNCAIAPNESGCQAACEIGGALSPDCSEPYEDYVACAGDRPIVACDDASLTVSAAALECIDPLSSYLLCAAESVLTACVAVPVQDAECRTAELGDRAMVCAAAPEGCALFEGSLRADGIGVFCCP